MLATTLTTLSGMVRGARGRMSAVTEEECGSVSSSHPTQDDINIISALEKRFLGWKWPWMWQFYVLSPPPSKAS